MLEWWSGEAVECLSAGAVRGWAVVGVGRGEVGGMRQWAPVGRWN